MLGAATPEAVMAAYAERINQHDFSLLVPLIAPDASFWFSSGTYQGHAATRDAFESTWRRLANETYWLEDLIWIAKSSDAASCIYRFAYSAQWLGLLRYWARHDSAGTKVRGMADCS